MMKTIKVAAAAVVGVLLVVVVAGYLYTLQPGDILEEESFTPDLTIKGQEYLKLLLDQQYTKLSEELERHLQPLTGGSKNGAVLLYALEAMARSERWMERHFDAWVAATPHRAVPYLARANYFMRQGIRARGTGYAHETSPDQFAAMDRFFELSRTDLEKAKKINSQSAFPYAVELEMSMRQPGRSDAQTVYQNGLDRNPGLSWLHRTRLTTLDPKWGGSTELQKQFITELRGTYYQYPWLQSVEAAWMLDGVEDLPGEPCDKVDAYREVYDFHRDGWTSYKLGKAYSCSRQFEEALPYLTEALDYWPYNALAWRVSGAIQKELDRAGEAIDSTKKALYLNPSDDFAAFQLGEISLYFERYGEAAKAFALAEKIDSEQYHYLQFRELAEAFVDEPGKAHELVILKTSSGPIMSRSTYINGRKEGMVTVYDGDNIQEFQFYENGAMRKVHRLNGHGDVVTEMQIEHGVASGPFIEYSDRGNPISRGTLRLGRMEGPTTVYFDNGKPVFKNQFAKGSKVGATEFWIPHQSVDSVRVASTATSGLSRLITPLDQTRQFSFRSGEPFFVYTAIDNPEKTPHSVLVRVFDAAGKLSFEYRNETPRGEGFNSGYVYYIPDTAKDRPGAWKVDVMLDGKLANSLAINVN